MLHQAKLVEKAVRIFQKVQEMSNRVVTIGDDNFVNILDWEVIPFLEVSKMLIDIFMTKAIE